MNVFLSWSGAPSKAAATVFHAWLGDVLVGVEAWMSAHDVKPGTLWASELHRRLAASDFGVLFLTRENLESAWLLYETGCLVMRVEPGRVVPYLLDLEPAQISGPLAQLQGVVASRDGSWSLLQTLNSAQPTPLSQDRLERLFEKWWPDLENALGLTLRVHLAHGFAVVQVGSNAEDGLDRLPRRVDALVEGGARGILIDLSAIGWLSSASFGQLVRPVMVCRKHGKPIALVGLQPSVTKLLRLSGLDSVIPSYVSVDTAIQALAQKDIEAKP